ncbi:M24 family metallopeptidase [Apilactobacillus timberlakei]|uniref:M24 family metallopeptidase n=1 Tax=Apilactobacillus timberlakei TaxID=2008380 RepID=UPI00112DC945|nr:Xaa-Pro peptidase family protein [Apilactobacillus timberlakei]TPR20656.1 aminopeptidase P family protein [Apilactobacillus timberlakei]TPR22699.1 aminopeptidase P family protein [Apilactobacillus timberlakei]
MTKLEQVQNWTEKQGLDFTYLSDPKTIQYLTGFFSDPVERVLALVVFPDKEPFMFAPALEVEAIKDTGFSYDVYGYLDHENPWAMIAEHVKERNANPKNAGLEMNNLTISRLNELQAELDVSFNTDVTDFMNSMRLIKTPDEIEKLDAAGREADYAFQKGFEAVKAGKPESAVMAELEYALKLKGVMEMSFDTLVQAGAHAAEPHGATGSNLIKNNEMVLFDLGTVHQGYISDSSRTVAVGKLSDKQKDIYNVCLDAQLTAMNYVKPGVTAESVDKVARDIIDKAGYGKYFIHRLGHGMGMSEHEFPSIMEGNKMELKPGMCFSIEPGIYVPGFAGVRIEDCVHVTENGCEPFTHTPKELKYL